MLDSLHESGIEIVSPNFMNTRQLPELKTIIPPKAQSGDAEESKDKPVIEKLVFDKAEEAESMEKVNEMLAETVKEIDSLKSQMKAALSDEASDKIKAQIEALNARRETISKLIEKTNADNEG